MDEETKFIDRQKSRYFFGTLVGALAGLYIYAAIDRSVYFYYGPTDLQMRNDLYWDDWLLRILAIIVANGAGSILAGIIARRKGKLVGVLSVSTSILFWGYCLFALMSKNYDLHIFNEDFIPRDTSFILIIVAIIVNGIIGYLGGIYGEGISKRANFFYEQKRNSLLGLKWFHFLWYPIIMYFILILGFFISTYIYERVILFFSLPEYSLTAILINLVSIPAFIGIFIIYQTCIQSYKILCGIDYEMNTIAGKIIWLGVLLILLPAIAIGLMYLTFYLESFFY